MAEPTTPGAGAHLPALDNALRETLERSFADRIAGSPGAELNLANAFWGDRPPPRDLGEALTWLGPTCVNVVVRAFERMRAVDPTLRLWRQVRYLRNTWYGASGGFKVVYADPGALRAHLNELSAGPRARRVARDLPIGGLDHQRDEPFLQALASQLASLCRTGELADADTWREVDQPEQEALHLCLGKHEPRPPELDDIHIDWSSPVVGIDEGTRRCRYGLLLGIAHWAQAKLGFRKPKFPFEEIDRRIDAAASRGDAPAAWSAFVARWREEKWPLALQGDAGAEEALGWLRECERLEAELR